MRVSVELEAYGNTMTELMSDANKQWQEFLGDDDASLPHDTEISVERHAEHEYKGTIYARLKVETNA